MKYFKEIRGQHPIHGLNPERQRQIHAPLDA
jgi:hypothetical protein